jgi:hypothetical protein
MLPNPQPYFANLPDPRRETKNKLHELEDIVRIVLCAVLSGIEDWVGMEIVAEEREGWFRGFLELPKGIPSHDTLSDVMGRGAGWCVWRRRPSHSYEPCAGKPGLDSPDGAELGATKRPSQGKP